MSLSSLKVGLLIVFGGLILTSASLMYHREDITGCNEPANPLRGANYCEAYGPKQFYGWPISYELNSIVKDSDPELRKITDKQARQAAILNWVVYSAGLTVGYLVWKKLKKT